MKPIIDRTNGRPPVAWLVWIAALAWWLAGPALGEPVFDAPDPGAVPLAERRLEVEAVGLTLRMPLDATSSMRSISGVTTVSVRLPEEAGVVSIQPRTSERELTMLEIEESLIEQVLGLPEETSGITIESRIETGRGVLLGRSPVVVAEDRILRPFYLRLKELAEGSYRGLAVLPVTRREYVLFNLYASEEDFERARAMFETMLGTIETGRAQAVDERRGEMVRAGAELLDGLTTEDYEAVIGDFPIQFERIYRAAPGGAERDEREVGYRRVQAWIGDQRDMAAGEPGNGPGSSPGYLLRLDGLVLLEDGRRADSESIYFLSRDRKREAWSVRMAIRPIDPDEGKSEPEVWTEVGARIGSSMSVQIDKGGRSIETVRPAIKGEGYVSRLEAYLMGPLLIHAGEPGDYAFYAYDQSAEANRLRQVELKRLPERPGLWRVITKRADGQVETADYNEYGRLIRSETTEGLLKRPIEFDRLYSIWEAKGLPLD